MTKLSDIVTVTIEPKPEVPKKKYSLHTDYRVAGKTFAEYVTRRMLKDGIGFNPRSDWKDSCTDLYSYIAAPIPKTDAEFITYCHELGHCKSKQRIAYSSFFTATFGGKWAKERLVSEVNAWKWGIRYFKRLGLSLSEDVVKVVQWSLNSYFKNADDYSLAEKLSEEFEAYSGIVTEKYKSFSSINHNYFGTTTFTYPVKPVIIKEKPKGWKPWHDLKQKQMKKSWKNCK